MDWKDLLGVMRDQLPEGDDCSTELEPDKPVARKDKLNIFIEKKGRNGKTATIVTGFTCNDEEVSQIATTLKKKLGVGGSARGGEILIQGNIADKVKNCLKELGFRV